MKQKEKAKYKQKAEEKHKENSTNEKEGVKREWQVEEKRIKKLQ